ncbi:MAG: dihydropteroate synthase [Xanthomonadales bacterium]|jgi:dihydropteroate synthase|nr:dihydropteroate synthase [Xanthomonadales bacterium]
MPDVIYPEPGATTLPRVMGVLNVTPDSFSDGGRWLGRDAAMRHAAAMVREGADIIDVGGESTRPGARAVSEQQELDRVIPVLEALAAEFDVVLSVDTSKAAVMRAAVAAGAGMLNDVCALRQPGALSAAGELGVPVCLMHMQGEPRSMQENPRYDDVVREVLDFLLERAAAAEDAGVSRSEIVIDPGFGFGKTPEHNLALLRALPRFTEAGYPVLAGLSRKRLLETLTGRPVEQRLAGSLALALAAARGGASIIRVHDVPETVDVLRVMAAAWPGAATA